MTVMALAPMNYIRWFSQLGVDDLARPAQQAREIAYAAPLPPDLVEQITAAYAKLKSEYGDQLTLAVRSSATAEDLPTASFAGQHETFLNISGEAKLLEAVRSCFASLFKDRAISYRIDKGFDHFKVYLSVGVMKMVRSDCASSGVIFTLDTETGFRDVVFNAGAYGLGENVVQGTVDPDEFYVFKPTFRQGNRTVLRRSMGGKENRMVYAKAAGRDTTRNVPTDKVDQRRFCIEDADVLSLADCAIKIEDHYSAKAGHPMPMDIEWAKDGLDGLLYIVQARPETVASQTAPNQVDEYELGAHGKPLVSGRAVGGKVATGNARVINDVSQLNQFQAGDVLVADTAFQTAPLPNDGVGLARMQFIVAEHFKAHPMALVHPESIGDPLVRQAIADLIEGYAKPADYFVRQLAEDVGTIAAAFYPKPVIVRMSDFKTNEYACLLDGSWFEPTEANPMIGFRGASRYSHPAYAEGFALECAAMKRVRDDMGLTNVKLMIPFCRRIDEAERVLAAMASNGLARGSNGLEIYVMCEIPNTVILIDEFAKLFDGFSIGSNVLTQLVLGVDRDSEIVAFDFDERDPGVKEMLRLTIIGARLNHRHAGICGQAPSDYPEIAEFLVEQGVIQRASPLTPCLRPRTTC
jgi:phosphoenolpyruvate synthase/pyruvate phosphate dikinase